MSEGMVERVARAIDDHPLFSDLRRTGIAEELARAAIEAMREPTPAMVAWAVEAEREWRKMPLPEARVALHWGDMIDAALGKD